MSVTAVIGAQWGDEAKGKIVDLLAGEADLVARFNGGDNAGHTVVNELGTFKLRLIPTGIANAGTTCLIGPGVVVNLNTLMEEAKSLTDSGIALKERLWISPRCHVVMPYHPLVETVFESAKGQARTGTTRRGMGPVFADKVSYNGIRLFDLADQQAFADKLRVQLKLKNPFLQDFGLEPLDFEQVYQDTLEKYAQIKDFVREPFGLLQQALQEDKNVLLEGAQAALLDTDWGTYPFSTASTTLAGGAAAGLGVAPRWIERVIGVAKAYTGRVGNGPMPTELLDETGELIRQRGNEYGTVTGRPRRTGWFDADLVRFTSQLNGCTEIALTKLDVLDTLPNLRVATGYRDPHNGTPAHYWQGDARWLEQVQPDYIELEGWMQTTTQVREFDHLPQNAQAYVRKIEELVETPVTFLSVGPQREAMIEMV